MIGHQQLLEALTWQGGGGHRHALLPWKASKIVDPEMDGELEVEVVVKLLKSLERLCPPKVSDSVNYFNYKAFDEVFIVHQQAF